MLTTAKGCFLLQHSHTETSTPKQGYGWEEIPLAIPAGASYKPNTTCGASAGTLYAPAALLDLPEHEPYALSELDLLLLLDFFSC